MTQTLFGLLQNEHTKLKFVAFWTQRLLSMLQMNTQEFFL